MDRREILTRGITKDMVGIEIGPWFAPLVPKAEGYRSLSLDVFDRPQLLERARGDEAIPRQDHDRIEEVDLIGGATEIGRLVEAKSLTGQIDYVISSHNFEHLPNPILFLRGCQKVLKPGGFVSMAIPDRRGCFDYFRPFSTTADFLEAFHAERDRPTAASIFELASVTARRTSGDEIASSWEHDSDGGTIHSIGDLRAAYDMFKSLSAENKGEYVDNHCFVFTKSSFELIIRELHFLGLTDVGIESVDGPSGCEFYTRLVNGVSTPTKSVFDAARAELLQTIIDESASNSRRATVMARRIAEQDATIRAMQNCIGAFQASRSWRLKALLRMLHTFFVTR